MKSLFNKQEAEEIQNRIAKLNGESTAQWGKMSAAQMCEHCALALDVNAGVIEETKPSFFIKLFSPIIKKAVFGPKPFKKNSPTSPQFIVKDQKHFNEAKEHLQNSFSHYVMPENRRSIVNTKSKLFGSLTEEEKGWSQYKHIDHHLTQFGV